MSADEDLRNRLSGELQAGGRVAVAGAAWTDALVAVASPTVRLVLIDTDLPGLDAALLTAMARSVEHGPQIRTVRGSMDGIPNFAQADLRAFRVDKSLPVRDRTLLGLSGLDGDAQAIVRGVVSAARPVWLVGERGTGKQWLARLCHRLATPSATFAILRPGETPVIGRPGTIFVDDADVHAPAVLDGVLRLASAGGWRVFASSRERPKDPADWTVLHMRPLREHPADIPLLVRFYVEEWRKRLGLARRTAAPSLLDRLVRHSWPGNLRELETFVVHAATACTKTVMDERSVPPHILAMLDPGEQDRAERVGYEQIVEARLRGLVERYEPTPGGQGLYSLVIDATERALLRLALRRTAGNQKAAAELLGIARNTLRDRLARIDTEDKS